MQVQVDPPVAVGCSLSRQQVRPLTSASSAHLDLIRAAAAWAVMWGHLRALFFVDFQHLEHRNKLLSALYLLTGFAHQAVMVFFVLSGFLISSAIIKRHVSGTWSWRDYSIDRSSRLYVVLIPGLLFGLLWDKAGSSLFASTGLYTRPLDGFGFAIARDGITVGNFVGNLFFLQTIACPTFGSNGPLWSLANEFWYYVLFPVALSAGIAWVNKSLQRAIPLTVLMIVVAIFVGYQILTGFFIWMAGVALVLAYSRFTIRPHGWLLPTYLLISIAVLVSCLTAVRAGSPSWLGGDFAVGIAFTLFLFGILQIDLGIRHTYYPRIAHVLAGFSYSLYVLHFPLLLFLRAWASSAQRWQPDVAHLWYGALVGTIVLSFAWMVSVVTENRTRSVRNWIRNAIPPFGDQSG